MNLASLNFARWQHAKLYSATRHRSWQILKASKIQQSLSCNRLLRPFTLHFHFERNMIYQTVTTDFSIFPSPTMHCRITKWIRREERIIIGMTQVGSTIHLSAFLGVQGLPFKVWSDYLRPDFLFFHYFQRKVELVAEGLSLQYLFFII